mmetsp:Transcript_86929/g.219300  ORF Transcript_86929/g.219300 Transcript_86929/m.219300 type:complete len:973 (-) Transcript_86929:222-3140(-)
MQKMTVTGKPSISPEESASSAEIGAREAFFFEGAYVILLFCVHGVAIILGCWDALPVCVLVSMRLLVTCCQPACCSKRMILRVIVSLLDILIFINHAWGRGWYAYMQSCSVLSHVVIDVLIPYAIFFVYPTSLSLVMTPLGLLTFLVSCHLREVAQRVLAGFLLGCNFGMIVAAKIVVDQLREQTLQLRQQHQQNGQAPTLASDGCTRSASGQAWLDGGESQMVNASDSSGQGRGRHEGHLHGTSGPGVCDGRLASPPRAWFAGLVARSSAAWMCCPSLIRRGSVRPGLTASQSSDAKNGNQRGTSAAADFAAESACKAFKFEIIYVLMLLCFDMLDAALTAEMPRMLTWSGRAAMLLYRWCRNRIEAPSKMRAVACGVLDLLVFVGAIEMGYSQVAPGSEIGQSYHIAVSQFTFNLVVLYLTLFVYPVKQALIMNPILFLLYACAELETRDEHDGTLDAILLVCLMGVGMCLVSLAKVFLERSQWQLFLLLREKDQIVIREKVLRCQAEFESDWIRGSFQQSSRSDASSFVTTSGNRGLGGMDMVKVSSKPQLQSSKASLCSAPAILLNTSQHSVGHDTSSSQAARVCEGGDCLPVDTLVWLEGEARPRALGEVTLGHRVLCFDRLGGSLKHAAVEDVRTEAGAKEWTRVTLDDGTLLNMTADHPVQPVATAAEAVAAGRVKPDGPFGQSRCTVCAADLQPKVDSLLVLKIVPVGVRSIETSRQDRPRVFVAVQQPERHAIFVASGGPFVGYAGQSVAIEAANRGLQNPVHMEVDKTFLRVGHRGARGQEILSAPPSLGGFEEVAAAEQLPGVIRDASGSHSSGSGVSCRSSGCSSVGDSTSSHSSRGDTEVFVGSSVTPRLKLSVVAAQDGSDQSETRLSHVVGIQTMGWTSLGSIKHASGSCQACIFENRHQHHGGQPCWKGKLCEFCHDGHDDLLAARKAKRRAWGHTLRKAPWHNGASGAQAHGGYP